MDDDRPCYFRNASIQLFMAVCTMYVHLVVANFHMVNVVVLV